MFSPRFGIEPLESRIAPAVFYVSGLKILDPSGHSVGEGFQEAAAQQAVGADLALLLHPGDTLYLHTGTRALSTTTDLKLVEVTAGDAMVFFTNGKTGNVHAFERTELTGLAVTSGFNGGVYTDVNGSVATVLDGNDAIATSGSNPTRITLQDSPIFGLHVAGQIAGTLLSGASLDSVDVHGPLYLPHAPKISVGLVATGSAAANQRITFNGGGKLLETQFTAAGGEDGGSIQGLTLTLGTTRIATGDGADNSNGVSGQGGSIGGLHIAKQLGPLSIVAGHGGVSAISNGAASGLGGSITASDVAIAAPPKSAIFIAAGRGGDSADGPGGDGGSLSALQIRGTSSASLTLKGGAGGQGVTGGGVGGSMLNLSVKTAGALDAAAGQGGGVAAGSNGLGGLGGSVVGGSYVISPGIKDDVSVAAGDGGSSVSEAGGQGGGIGTNGQSTPNQTTFDTRTAVHAFALHAGNAGTSAAGFNGSAGGGISNVLVNVNTVASLSILGGNGASGSIGGAGGGIGGFSLATQGGGHSGVLTVAGGDGGGATYGGSIAHADFVLGASNTRLTVSGGGNGGAIDDVNVVNSHNTGAVIVGGGNAPFSLHGGGDVSGVNVVNETPHWAGLAINGGSGVSGGSVSQITVTNFAAALAGVSVIGGEGAYLPAQFGPVTGPGGGLQNVHIVNFGTMGNSLIWAGDGAPGGSIDDVTIDSTPAMRGPAGGFSIAAGRVSLGSSAASVHGDLDGGDVSNVKLNAPNAFFRITAGDGSNTNIAGDFTGKGGAVSNISGSVGGIDIFAGAGGSSPSGTNDGGVGGNVSGVSLVTKMARTIAAGNGGEGKTGGAGGSIGNVTVSGDIGDFTATFGGHALLPRSGSMGGLVAGKAGPTLGGGNAASNGSIDNVSAGRIAAIFAGYDPFPEQLTYGNAVASISNLHAAVLGADTHVRGQFREIGTNGGIFDYWNSSKTHDSKFEPDNALDPLDGDVPVDGFVMVQKGGLLTPLPVTPLLLIEV